MTVSKSEKKNDPIPDLRVGSVKSRESGGLAASECVFQSVSKVEANFWLKIDRFWMQGSTHRLPSVLKLNLNDSCVVKLS